MTPGCKMNTFKSGCSTARNSWKRACASLEIEYADCPFKNGSDGGRKPKPLEYATIVPPAFLFGRKARAKI